MDSTIYSPLEDAKFISSKMDSFNYTESDFSSFFPLSYANDWYSFMDYHHEQYCCPGSEDDTNLSDQLMSDVTEDISDWLVSESSLQSDPWSASESPVSSDASTGIPLAESSLILPSQDSQIDNQVSLFHLLKAYGEAVDMEHKELAEEITRRLKEKANVAGSTLQRLAFYMIKPFEKDVDYLRQEAIENYDAASKAFYQLLPYGMFAHFIANSTILESIPDDAYGVHIVDFDIGSGVQWPPLLESLANRGQRLVRLTSIKWQQEEDCSSSVLPLRRFEETKRQLHAHSQCIGVRLMVEEMDMEELVCDLKKKKKRGGGSEMLAFNCMVGLPHMGRARSSKHVVEFLKIAKDSIKFSGRDSYGNKDTSTRGIITFGEGSNVVRDRSGGYGSFFEGMLVQFQALLESIECSFPQHLVEARVAMECIFLAPNVSSCAGLQRWEERTIASRVFSEIGLQAWRMRRDHVLEAKELVREGESSFSATVGEEENQIVLGYKGTTLVRISSWT